jgi:hypothetical protein
MGFQCQGERPAGPLLRDQAVRNFTNQVLWPFDPNCLLRRQRFHNSTDSELRSRGVYAGMSGGVMMTSDDLGEVPAVQLRWWRLCLNDEHAACRFSSLARMTRSWYRCAARRTLPSCLCLTQVMRLG